MTTEQGSRSFYREESCNRNPNIASRSTREMFPSGEMRQSSRHQCSQGFRNGVIPPQRSHRKPCPVHSSRRSRGPSVSRELKISKPKCPSDQDFSGITRQLQGLFTPKADSHKQSEFQKITNLSDKMGLQNEELLVSERDLIGFSDGKRLAAGEQAAKEPGKRRSSSLPKSPGRLSTIDGNQYEALTTHNRQTQTKPMDIPPYHDVPISYQRKEAHEEPTIPPKPVIKVTNNESPPQKRPESEFINIPPQKRPEEFMNIPPQCRPGSEFMNIPPRSRPESEFINIPPRNRPEPEFMNIPPRNRPEPQYINIPPQNVNVIACDKPVCERQDVSVGKNHKSSPENEGYGDNNTCQPIAYECEHPTPLPVDDRGFILHKRKEDSKNDYFGGKNESSNNNHCYDPRNKNMDSKSDQCYNYFEGRNEHSRVEQCQVPDFGDRNVNYARIDRPFNFGDRNEYSRIGQCHDFGKKYDDPRIHHDSLKYFGNKHVDPRMHRQSHNFGDRNEDPRFGQCYDFQNRNADPRIHHQYSNFGDRNEDFMVGKPHNFGKNNVDSRMRKSLSFAHENEFSKKGHFGNMHEDSRIRQSSNYVDRNEDSKIVHCNDFEKKNVDPRIEQGCDFGDRNENFKIDRSNDFENQNVDSRTDQSQGFGERNDESNFRNEEPDQYKDFKDNDVTSINDKRNDFQGKNNVAFEEPERVAIQEMTDEETEDYTEYSPEMNPVCQEVTSVICQPESKTFPPEKVTGLDVQDINSNKTRKPKMNVCLKLVQNKNGEICVVKDDGCNHK